MSDGVTNQSAGQAGDGEVLGSLAHDLNNLLGVILNYAGFVAAALDSGSQAHRDLEEVRGAAARAVALLAGAPR